MVADKRRRPDDDVISELCKDDALTDVEIAVLAVSLLFAGYETTVVQIWMHAVHLLSEESRWQALLDDPSLIPKATDELIRASYNFV